MNNDIDTYDNQRYNMTNDSKSNIWTHIASQFEGLHVYDEVFSMSSIKDEKIGFEENGSGSWITNLRTNSIRGTDSYSYESTVENLASSIIVHEWYSHRMKKNGDKMKSHRLAYKNVINYKYFWNKTTDNYKGFRMPFFWSNCKNRFLAMKYAYAGDTIKRNEYIGNIIKNIEEYLQDNQESLDSICVLEDLAYMMHQTLPWVLVRYYYYLSIIDSQEVIKNKIDILLKKGYNMDFLELLNTSHEDFLIFTGF